MRTALVLVVVVVAAAALAGTSAMAVDDMDLDLTKTALVDKDVDLKQRAIMKILNHVLQVTMYDDVRDISRNFKLEDNLDKFMKIDVVKDFLYHYKVGMLPRAEIFTVTNEKQLQEVIKVFHVLFFAKDFDTFIRTACWMRERLNCGMFVYAMTVAVLHRDDCRGILLPAPYEIYPYYFVNSDVIHKAYIVKMKRGMLDHKIADYYGIRITDKNVVMIDARKDLRHTLNMEDKLNYFTEDIDLNSYYYYFHMDYPFWMGDDIFNVNKDRRGELTYYIHQQLLARHKLERLSHGMKNIKMLYWDIPLKTGYWPKLRLHNGEDMPMRDNDKMLVNEDNQHFKRLVDDYERRIRDAIMNGFIVLRDGSKLDLKKPEDIEVLGRLINGNIDKVDVKFYRYLIVFMRTLFGYSTYNLNKDTYIPTVLDQFETCLRDPLYWKLLKRITDNFIVFKKMLPMYTRDEFDFPGIKIEGINVDKLVTFFDDYDIDITNAVMLDESEMKKGHSDFVFVARQRRLNHDDFKVTIDVVSDKTVDCVVRLFLGPKYDVMGRMLNVNDKRLDMVDIDSFLYKLQTGKNVIVRDSKDMHNVMHDRTWTRKIFDKTFTKEMLNMDISMNDMEMGKNPDNFWYQYRTGFPKRLLLPKGRYGGLQLQMYVIVSPVRTGKTLNVIDKDMMLEKHVCRYTVCFDSMPLGYPFDRHIDVTKFFTNNMRFLDVLVYHKDVNMMNDVKGRSDIRDIFYFKRDDLTYMDTDLLVKNDFLYNEMY